MADIINTYQWIGINKEGKRLKGTIQAIDINNAKIELIGRDIEVIDLKIKRQLFSFPVLGRKIKKREILNFTRYLSTMIAAGMPILQSFEIIERNETNEHMQFLIRSIKMNVASGKTITEAFRLFPAHFSELFCSLINTGEQSGTLEKMLRRASEHLEKAEKLKSKIKRASIYPGIVISVAVVVSLILLLFVVPQFEAVFKSVGAQLPYFTRQIVNISNFLRKNILFIMGGVIVLFLSIRFVIRRNEKCAELFDRFKLRIWVIGPLLKKSILARFTSTLALTLEAGLPIVEAMKIMTGIMDNLVYKKAVLQICSDLNTGHPLAESMEKTAVFPNLITQMIAVGEISGALPDMLNHINEFYEEEINNTVENLGNIIEPFIIIILGIIIGSFVVAMYLPIFKLGALY